MNADQRSSACIRGLHLLRDINSKDPERLRQLISYQLRHPDQHTSSHLVLLGDDSMIVIETAERPGKRESVLREIRRLRGIATLRYHLIKLLRQYNQRPDFRAALAR